MIPPPIEIPAACQTISPWHARLSKAVAAIARAIIVVEMSLSIGLNFYNSYLLKHVPGFNFPLIYTAVHMLTSFIGASVLISCFGAATVGWSELRAHLPQVGPPCCFPRFLAAPPDRLHYSATASSRRALRPCSQ